jgi:hypothetical protein
MEKWYEKESSAEEIKENIIEKIALLRDISVCMVDKEKALRMMAWLGEPAEFNAIAKHIDLEQLGIMLELMTGLKDFVHDYPYKVMEENLRLKNMDNYLK